MSDHDMPRLVMVVPNWPALDQAYMTGRLAAVEAVLRERLILTLRSAGLLPERQAAAEFRVDYLASHGTGPKGLDINPEVLRRLLVCGIVMTGGERAAALLVESMTLAYGPEAGIGADLPVRAAGTLNIDPFWTHGCPGEADYHMFGRRADALRAMGATQQQLADAGLSGADRAPDRVNLVVVDTGLPPSLIRPLDALTGWEVAVTDGGGLSVRKPGEALTGHGAMVAGNALALVSDTNVLDCPAIPDGITDLPAFLGWIVSAMLSVKATVVHQQGDDAAHSLPPRSWVICNAWGVFDPGRELPEAPYSNNPAHPLAQAYRDLAQLGVDIVFAAGNCGQFCPNGRCSPDFTGPGRSINGANAMPEALTVGAVRHDGLWLGYSGQGPGITGLAPEKPDLCAPSQFENDLDAGSNTGTSAACGLAAGAVALLRTRWPSSAVDPAALRAILRETAVQPYGPPGWQGRTGHGMVNVAAAAAALDAP
ncbi:MAG TPA: S8 family serine peptidase [Roseomonas sp.]|nr:S8 family serine peptidase [Roseomonas sp.]